MNKSATEVKVPFYPENRNVTITLICVIFTFGHGLAMHNSLNITMVKLEVVLDL